MHGINIVWFKRDLRTFHHRPLCAAVEDAQAFGRGVLPLFIVEPALWSQPDMSARQWGFVRESLLALQSELADLGQPLIIRTGDAIRIFEEIHESHPIIKIYAHEETGNGWTYQRDLSVSRWCRDHGIVFDETPQTGVVRRLKSRTGWARHWDKSMARSLVPTPAAIPPVETISPGEIPTASELYLNSDHCPDRQPGGRPNGLHLLNSFLSERGRTYRTAMSSPVPGFAACSRLSPHLAWGTIAMAEVAQAAWKSQAEIRQQTDQEIRGSRTQWRGALSSFQGRLHWHCHFMQKLEDEPKLEFENLHPSYNGLRPTIPDQDRLVAWAKGETGLPFVDATMRALIQTGWMNFRMRAMLMAVASYHLWLDWRKPGEHLARMFTDYEPGIHWPQVQMQSGTTGINTVRIYNPVKQGRDQDPKGQFIRAFLPELAEVPDEFIHTPWAWEGAGRLLGSRYPYPIVDHLEAAKSARQKIWAVRGGTSFRETANAIQEKHGSRKSGVKNRGQRRKRVKTPTDQLSLFDQRGDPA
ncbi:MAG: deoxyribodipyrimidine photo-lyase [Pseudomonadota bacterium]